ncbi:hypothetical protein FF38_01810 [Lucilia cuprina]|uniref:Uncharacterized protein n=1 Tax=Lucilia cuprina TaxID=7375 RepID=A0A0L0BVJ2_LUCCU|nr:hypothetical protein FF38_01810 [Lucilia cuprina]
MKGQLSIPAYYHYMKWLHSICPSLEYSGGDPLEIPNLEYESLVQYHRQKYHRNNCFTFSYGNLEADEVLNPLGKYLSEFTPSAKPDPPAMPIPLTSPTRVSHHGPVDPGLDENKQHKISLTWYLGNSQKISSLILWRVISLLLNGGHSSPFYKALIDSKLGTDFSVNTGIEETPNQLMYTIGLVGIGNNYNGNSNGNGNNNYNNNGREDSRKGFVDSRRPKFQNKRFASNPKSDDHTDQNQEFNHQMPVPIPPPGMGLPDFQQFSELVSKLDSAKLAEQTFQPETFNSDLDLITASQTDVDIKLIGLLYDEGLPLQCSTCGFRFKDTEEGHKAEDNEMDWHFRANKDIRENHSRNRCWFMTRASWINYKDEDEVYSTGKLENETNTLDTQTEESEELSAKDLESLKTNYVEIPADSEGTCPVCQEPYETSWSEEAENWVWTNAVEINGHHIHATCSADPRNKKTVEYITSK